jgi:hypothetical protein
MEHIAQNKTLACPVPTYNPTPPFPHYPAIDDDDATIGVSNCSHNTSDDTSSADTSLTSSPLSEALFQASHLNIASDHAIADAGATGHFVLPGTPVSNINPAQTPLIINLPDGKQIASTHTCKLNVPWLPDKAREAHIVPDLAHASLVSIKTLCDAGCKVQYNSTACSVYFQGSLVWIGKREPTTGLWILPLNPKQTTDDNTSTTPQRQNLLALETTEHLAQNAYTMTSKEALIKYLHQCLFSPPKRTLIKAINNNQFSTWPGLTANAVQRYLPDSSPATDKGHMKRQKQGIRSTKTKLQAALNDIETARDMNPPREPTAKNHLFCYAGGINTKDGTIYVDFTGKFPIRSIDGMTALFILYDWTTNAILATPVKDGKDETTIATFEANIQYLTKRGFKPVLNIIDNVASKTIQTYLADNAIKIQLVEPHNHRVNAAERAIQTFKNHMIAGLSTCDEQFPSLLWDRIVTQAQDSLNMLRTSRVHPQLSAYQILEGAHDFNRVPWAPPGTRATIFNPPETRTSWGPRAIDAWYIGPAKQHYRCYSFYLPSTGGTRTSGQATFYPQHCAVPIETRMDETRRIAEQLVQAVKRLQHEQTAHPGRHTAALHKLASIFKDSTGPIERVAVPTTQTSTNPTATANIRTAPRTHDRVTRNNQPRTVPTILAPPAILSPSEGVPSPIAYPPPRHTRLPGATHRKRLRRREANPRRSPRFTDQLNVISQETVQHAFDGLAAAPPPSKHQPLDLEHFCSPVIHPVTGETIHTYQKLAKDPVTREVWTTAFGKEFGNLAQGDAKTGTEGTNSIFILERNEIPNIPGDRTVTYARIVVDHRPQKPDPNRVRITAGGNLIDYPGKLTTRTADLTSSKIIWNSVLSTRNAKYMCVDIKNFYLCSPLDRYEYM